MNDLVLKNSKLVNKSGSYYVSVNDGKIANISKQPLKADVEIDINEKFVLPGLIDPHVHFRDPGLTYKESFKSGSFAAANGGFTTIIDMPNTVPQTNTAENFKEKMKIAKNKSIVDFGLHSGINNLEEIKKIAELKPSSFKIFMDLEEDNSLDTIFRNISIAERDLNSENSKSQKFNLKITVHGENKAIIEDNTERLKKMECIRGNAPIDYSYARPSKAEVVSVKYAISLAKKYNIDLHICHLSTKEALDIAKLEQKRQYDIDNTLKSKTKQNKTDNTLKSKTTQNNTKNTLKSKTTQNNTKNTLKSKRKQENTTESYKSKIHNITTEITPHHLLLDSDVFDKYGTIAKTNPPLRLKGENLAVTDLGDIDMIGTDHAPHTLEEKERGVWNSAPGIPNLETVLSLLLTEVNKGSIELSSISKLLSENPAKIFGLKNKGNIEVGKDADFVVVDLKKEGKFNLDNFYTKAKYTPFENYEYKGIAIMTISNGNIIMNDGDVIGNNEGKYVHY
ncbi:dihydroorotase [Methanobrevibacter cuticularis]|nr:dihydroorotase family protein [Methanobrevibacter cuticularis]